MPTFTVLYEDIDFQPSDQVKLRESRQITKSQTGMDGAILSALYNKDLSYNYYVQLNDENTMVQNVYTLLLSRTGSRMMLPDYGIGIEAKVFSLVDDPLNLEIELLSEIDEAIKIYEPRVTLIKSQSYIIWDDSANSLKIILSIRVPSGSVKKVGVTLSNIQQDT